MPKNGVPMKKIGRRLRLAGTVLALSILPELARAQPARNILIHVKTALSQDDAQICVAPNVALAALKAGDKVTILFDASAVTSIAKGFGLMHKWSGTDAMDRAGLPDRERRSLSEQFGVPLDQIPRNYGEYLDFLKARGAEIYVNKTMLVLYNIDPARVAPAVTPIPLEKMVGIFGAADRIIAY